MTEKKNTLGVVIITKNEEKNIARCLESVKWADEIIVVDSGSTDKTLEIAKSYGAKVYHQDWLGFGEQKNIAIDKASSAWLLALDADEVVNPELKESILKAINDDKYYAYKFKRLSQFCGQWIHHGDWGRDVITRLFKRTEAKYSNDIIHERLITTHNPQLISGILLHYSQEDMYTSIKKYNEYSSLSAKLLANQGKNSSLAIAVSRGYLAFLRSYLLRLGFLDGKIGYIIARNISWGTYLKYLKLTYYKPRR